MKFNIVIALIFCCLWSCQNKTDEQFKTDPGVSWELAKHRKETLSNINYHLSFNLSEDKTAPIRSNLELQFTLNDVDAPLVLDFSPNNAEVPKVFMVSGAIETIYKDEHLIIPQRYLKTGENAFKIQFQAGDQYLNRNEEYLYTLSVPDHARALFPCFDQPNLKATYKLELVAPNNWSVLSATHPESTIKTEAHTTYVFNTTELMSTYLFSFVAGKFDEVSRDNHRFMYREQDSLKIAQSLDPIYQLHKHALSFLEDYTNYEFPFSKLDFAAIPFFPFGGMEHVGAIQYKESSLFFEDYMPKLKHWNRANLISHEVAHMWFGNLVTMDWFNDVWLKEVFANFMAAKVVNPSFPEFNFELLNLVTKAPSAYAVDRTKGTNAIRQNLDNLNNAGSLYGGIIYNKAPIMMNQLEMLLGKEQFKLGLQEYIKTYANSNATWNDLVSIFDAKSSADIKAWSDVWVNQSGRPVFTNDIVYKEDVIQSLTLHQKAEDGSANLWPQQLEVALIYSDSIAKRIIHVHEASQNIRSIQGLPKPKAIVYNSNGSGYGVFPIDANTALNSFQIQDDVVRASNYINTYENALSGNIPVQTALRAFLNGLEHETNELIISTVSSDFGSLYWDFLSEAEREKLQPELSKRLWNRLNTTLTTSVKKSVYASFSNLAYQDESLNQLYAVWNKNVTIDSLKLNEKDFTSLAMTLALYAHPKHDNILNTAYTQITSQDAKERFQFLRPALAIHSAERQALFESFKNVENRKNTDWVYTANQYIHHPLHQKEAIAYLPLSLTLLEDVKNTSDLFFPLKWLSSTIGNYQSSEAQIILDDYLSQNPHLNHQLKAKLLQATDNLSRYRNMIKN
ncbi:membrane alanine aminopeptidase N [Formosa agariphila KMM 3901]|uniref:Aminopeptidase N n=1 Tax=Formosa agariphila (strain DSM 15362 / KCTC 12365 / LMG 23005 / KMM 3901 / M-2Alg 35-1) TaxID=1347342 RepID=T2KS17_FORAG|nr:M1 family aminopeptidase [Formosa agariphila]CDF80894.1 membrane alanine aminopeptidase N [Formosa agariphila KMM 3901]